MIPPYNFENIYHIHSIFGIEIAPREKVCHI